MSDVEAALISIKPAYAEAILSGRKSVELRRRIPSVTPGLRLFIYSTLPVGAVVGAVTLERVARGTPTAIWEEFGPLTGVNRADYDDYFAGVSEALGLLLRAPRRVPRSDMRALRSLREGFHPPQVMVRLSAEEALALEGGSTDATPHPSMALQF